VKDIYSPLEIDEEWDQRAPNMGSNDGSSATVTVTPESGVANISDMSSEENFSTLPPNQAADMPNSTNTTFETSDNVEPADDMTHDPAHDAAQSAIEQAANATSDSNKVSPTSADTLNINEINSTQSGDINSDTATATQEPAPMKINVIGDAEVDEPGNKVEAGETFNPATFPDGKMPEPKTIEPETKEDKEPELPTSPVDEEEKSELESKEEVEAEGSTEMDSTDKRLMAAIEEWNKAKERTYDKLKKLKEDVEADINRTRADIADLEKHVEIKEKEREEIQNQLDELGDVKSAA
jgi:hypothetical protein